jgi:hypothetical protein
VTPVRGQRAAMVATAMALLALLPAASFAAEATNQALALAGLWPDSVAAPAWVAQVSPGLPRTVPPRIRSNVRTVDVGMLAVRGDAAGAVAGGRHSSSVGGRAGGTLTFAPAGGPTFELRTQALTTRRPDVPGSGGMRTEVMARFGDGGSRLSLDAGVERDLGVQRLPTRGVFSIGVDRQHRDVAMGLKLEQSRRSVRVTRLFFPEPIPGDTLAPVPIAVERTQDVSAVSARLGARWQRGRWMIESAAGLLLHRFASPHRWAQSSFLLGLGRDLALSATIGGSAPRWLALEPAAERRVSLGLRLAPEMFPAMSGPRAGRAESPTWNLVRGPRGWTVIQVCAKGAGRVELIGDFTGWQATSLRRVGGSRWELGLALEPGMHQVNLRVDGGPWTPPAGLPTMADGFDGMAGVLVVE